MNDLAVGLWILYFVAALAVPVAIRVHRTGSTGLRLGRAHRGSVQWLAETVELVALGAGIAAPLAADELPTLVALDNVAADVAGALLFGE